MKRTIHLATRIPGLMVGVACVCTLFLAHRYLDGLDQRTVLAVDQENVARFDAEDQQRYRYFRAHDVSAERAFRQVLTEWERERLSQPPLPPSRQAAPSQDG